MIFQVRKNPKGEEVVFESEKSLASFQDPQKEARQWVDRLSISSLHPILILGLGSGYHIRELLQRHPHQSISVVDFRSELFSIFENVFPHDCEKIQLFHLKSGPHLDERIFNFIVDRQPTVIPFRPSWQNHHNNFTDLWARLTLRHVDSLSKSLKSEIEAGVFRPDFSGSQDQFLHLKNIFESLVDLRSESALSLATLRELWI